MIFSLHFHTFVFLTLPLLIIIEDYLPSFLEKTMDYVILLGPAVYFAIALYVVYRPCVRSLLWKIPMIMVLYFIICVSVIILFLVLIVAIFEGTNLIQAVFSTMPES